MNATYYALIRRHGDGRLSAWIPDIPDVMASGLSEEEVIQELSRRHGGTYRKPTKRGCLGRRREGSMI